MVFIRKETEGPTRTQEQQSAFYQALAGLNEALSAKDPIGPPEPEMDPEVVKDRIQQIKKYLPYLALIGIVFAVKHLKKNGLAKSVDLVALSNVIQAFTPLITAVGWVLFTRLNDTARNLSFAFATAETIPAIDLNLPPGVNLGSYFVVGDELLDMIPNAKDWLEQAGEEAIGLTEQVLAGLSDLFLPEHPLTPFYKDILGKE